MTSKSKILTALLVSFVVGASIADAHPRRLNDDVLVGGYSPVEDFETNEGVNTAATFVSEEFQSGNFRPQTNGVIADVEVVGANQQVVAGMNYQLDMVFRDSSGACVGGATVVVYDRFGELSITQWEGKESLCEDADPPGSTDESAAATGSWIRIVPRMMPMMILLLLLLLL